MAFDSRCYALVQHFYPAEEYPYATEAERNRLAQAIQDLVESWDEAMKAGQNDEEPKEAEEADDD